MVILVMITQAAAASFRSEVNIVYHMWSEGLASQRAIHLALAGLFSYWRMLRLYKRVLSKKRGTTVSSVPSTSASRD